MTKSIIIITAVTCFVIGFISSVFIKFTKISRKIKNADAESLKKVQEAQKKADTILKEADLDVKDRLFRMKNEFEAETKETQN